MTFFFQEPKLLAKNCEGLACCSFTDDGRRHGIPGSQVDGLVQQQTRRSVSICADDAGQVTPANVRSFVAEDELGVQGTNTFYNGQ